MRCCASPTTCNVDSADARSVGVALEAMLLTPMLQPLVTGMDAIGTYGLGAIARELAEADSNRFAALVSARPA
jgi:hypothetical protein